MADETRRERSNRADLSAAFSNLVTKTRRGDYQVRIPSEGRVIKVPSEKNAKVIAEAEALRQKLAAH